MLSGLLKLHLFNQLLKMVNNYSLNLIQKFFKFLILNLLLLIKVDKMQD